MGARSTWTLEREQKLLAALYGATFDAGALTEDVKAAVVAEMNSDDSNANWDQIRHLNDKMARWEDIRDDLIDAIINVHGSFTKEEQVVITQMMNDRGHNMVWNAIR
ncbi:hypothetical protein OQA88_12217 [Cercophora sp. LCS_1]